MKLEEITAEIRPRTQWESIDLGVALTRRHFPKLFLLWAITVFPIWALIIFLLRDSPIWALVVIMFFRPLYERPLVYYLSRALFNAPPPISEIIKRYFKIIWPGLLHGLTIARFSPMRSLLMPLYVLEGASGKQYKKRRIAILRNGGGTATYLTFICAFIEFILTIGIIFFVFSFLPSGVSEDLSQWLESLAASLENADNYHFVVPPVVQWFLTGTILVAITLTELFYVGCGFAIYLNSRSHVEGWDIEITFRRLASKLASLQGIIAASLLGALLFVSGTGSALADEPAEIKQELNEILAKEEFTIHTEELRVYQTGDSDGSLAGFAFLAMLGQFLFIVLIAAAVIGLVYLIYANRHLFSGIKSAPKEEKFEKTRTVMGMDVASDTLPDDIPAAALAAWRDGDPQQATSLLYRGAICWLVEAAKLPLIDSDTENDCLQHSSTLDDATRHDYFSKLTSQWVRTAYNESPPSESDIQQLCSTWPFDLKEVKS